MAKINCGRNAGKVVKLHQWCNDWISDQDNKVYSPCSLLYTSKEAALIMDSKEWEVMKKFYKLKMLNKDFKYPLTFRRHFKG